MSNKAICKECGKEYVRTSNGQKYCVKCKEHKETLKRIKKPRKVKCEYCGQEFTVINNAHKYCSVNCRKKHEYKKRRERYSENKKLTSRRYKSKHYKVSGEQPCWTCTKACGGCSWSRSLKPIEGWEAIKVGVITHNVNNAKDFTYKIIECPEFEKEMERK